jgi:hypothetical protein
MVVAKRVTRDHNFPWFVYLLQGHRSICQHRQITNPTHGRQADEWPQRQTTHLDPCKSSCVRPPSYITPPVGGRRQHQCKQYQNGSYAVSNTERQGVKAVAYCGMNPSMTKDSCMTRRRLLTAKTL